MLAAVVTVVTLTALIGTASAAGAEVMLPGIEVGGIPIGNLSAHEASAKLMPASRVVEARELSLVVGERSWNRTPKDLGITVDMKATVDAALKKGRGPLNWVLHTIGGADGKVAWVPRINKERFNTEIKELAREVKVEATNGNIEFSSSNVVAKPPTEGIQLVLSAARKDLLKSALSPAKGGRIALPVTVTPPDIGEDDVKRIEEQARGILSAPVAFVFEAEEISISPEKIASAMRVNIEDGNDKKDVLLLQVDPDALKDQIAAVAPHVAKTPRDASFSVSDGKVSITPSEEGKTIDTATAANLVLALTPGPRLAIPLNSKSEPPAFTTDQARDLKITERISTFTTTFDSQNAPRVANIDRMAESIDGTVLKPGETFSMNDTTGPRTPANGYQEAQIIVDGELVPGIGGGVCQVATTVFNAVFNAGLDTVQRSNHSLHITKYPLGRDAMVNYPSQDLKFQNDTQYGVLVKAAVTSRSMIVSIYSSPLKRTVETATSDRSNPREPPTKYVDDPTLPAGQEHVVEEGSAGFDVTVTRRVVSETGVELHNEKFLSKYQPWKRIIRRGTGPPASPSPTPKA